MRLQLFTFLAGNKTFIKVLCIWGGRSDNRGVWKRTANGWVGIKGLREHIERGIWDSARTLFSIFMWLCSFPSLACPAREIRFRLPLIIGTLWGQAFLSTSTADNQPDEHTRVRLISMVPHAPEFYFNVPVRYNCN